MNVLIIYDDGCQNCQVSYNLRSYSLGDREATFTMKTLGDSKELHGGVGRFQIQSMHNPNQSLILDCLYNDLKEVFIRSQRVDVPRAWQERFGLNPVHYTPQGWGVIVIGSDMQAWHPWPIALENQLVLYRSQFDGQYIIGGSLSEADMHKYGPLPDINTVAVRRVAVETSLF